MPEADRDTRAARDLGLEFWMTMIGAAERPPRVSVIVPVYNDVERLRLCVHALLEQDYPADCLEVLIVDNASTQDVTSAIPPGRGVILLRETRPGSYAARNAGLAFATGAVIAFTDSDCIPDSAWVQEGVRALRQLPRAAMVGGAVELFYPNGSPRTGAEWWEWRHSFRQQENLSRDHYSVTANLLCWRTTVEEYGPFDARLRSGGDVEWGRRVAAGGGLQRYAPAAVVRHPARARLEELLVQARRHAGGHSEMALDRRWGRLNLMRLAAGQVSFGARAVVAVAILGRPPHGMLSKARYLATCLAVCSVHARVIVQAALRRSIRRSPKTHPSEGSTGHADRNAVASRPRFQRVTVGRTSVHALRFDEAVQEICRLASDHSASMVVTPNIQHIALLESDEEFRRAYAAAELVLPDGWPVVAAMRLQTRGITRRVTGADLLPALCAAAVERGLSVGFLGGADRAVAGALDRMRLAAPGLRGHLAEEPPMGFERDPDTVRQVVEAVNQAAPDILFVGLGAPKQELFVEAHLDEMNVGVAVCVGAGIDFAAGRHSRAPRWLQACGLEWAYRVAREPRRLARRYVRSAPVFVRVVARDLRGRVVKRLGGF